MERDGLEPKTVSDFGSLHGSCVSLDKLLARSGPLHCLL